MATTVKEFITEFGMYPHSHEHYDLMKECAELQVTAQFLDDQKFMAERAGFISGGEVTFTEGYFSESVDSVMMDAVTNNFNEKAGNLKSRIGEGFKKILTVFVNFFKKIIPIFDKDYRRAETIKKTIANVKNWDDANFKKLSDVVSNARKESGFVVAENQASMKEIKINHEADVHLKEALAAALASKVATADVTQTGKGASIGAIDVKTISKCYKQLNGSGRSDARAIKSLLETTWAVSQETGIPIYVRGDAISTAITELEKFLEGNSKLIEILNGDEDNEPTNVASGVAMMNEVYSKMNSAISGTMSVYTAYRSFRSKVISGCEAFFKEAKFDVQTKEKPEKPEETTEA